MSIDISPQNEAFLDSQIADGVFHNRREALDAAVELLRQQSVVLDRVDRGRRQLDEGEFTEYDDDSLAHRFDELKRRASDRAEE